MAGDENQEPPTPTKDILTGLALWLTILAFIFKWVPQSEQKFVMIAAAPVALAAFLLSNPACKRLLNHRKTGEWIWGILAVVQLVFLPYPVYCGFAQATTLAGKSKPNPPALVIEQKARTTEKMPDLSVPQSVTTQPVLAQTTATSHLLKMDVPAWALNVEVWLDNKRIATRVTNDNLLAVVVPAKEGPTHFELKGSRYDTKPFDIIVNQNGEIFPYTGDLRIYPE